jgi:hypothetical protein
VRTGSIGAFVWAESPATKTNVPSKKRTKISFPDTTSETEVQSIAARTVESHLPGATLLLRMASSPIAHNLVVGSIIEESRLI